MASENYTVTVQLEYESKRLTFPINPNELRMNIDSSSETLDVIGLGEVSIPKKPKLATININSFFWLQQLINYYPSNRRHLYSTIDRFYRGFDHLYYIEWLKEWQMSKKPADLVVTGVEHFSMRVICDKFWYEVRAGEEDTIYFELSLKEYREHGAQKVNVDEDEFVASVYSQTENRADNLEVPKQMTVPEDNGNAVALGRSNGTDGLTMVANNMDQYDVMTGEFLSGGVINVPPKPGSPGYAESKAAADNLLRQMGASNAVGGGGASSW